jgi:hypothetical protein
VLTAVSHCYRVGSLRFSQVEQASLQHLSMAQSTVFESSRDSPEVLRLVWAAHVTASVAEISSFEGTELTLFLSSGPTSTGPSRIVAGRGSPTVN